MAYFRLCNDSDDFDILPYIIQDGIKWSDEDEEGPNGGKAINGNIIRDVIAQKQIAKVSCEMDGISTVRRLMTILKSKEFTVITDINPTYGSYNFSAFCSTRPATLLHIDDNDGTLWNEINFTVTELI